MKALDALDGMWSAFDSIRAKHEFDTLGERPPGSMTAAEYRERYRLNTDATAYAQLRKMESTGHLKRQFVREADKRGHLSRIAVWVPCQ